MTVGRPPLAQGEPLELHRGERVGKYELLALLTVGGMSEVFLAFTTGPGGFRKYVVLKRILPEVRSQEHFVQMFLDEARITASLNHANIGQVFDLGEDDEGGLYLTMEFIPGQNLNQIYRAALKRGMRGLPVGLSCSVVRDVCRALHHAHSHLDPSGRPAPVIHRDVAQKNIMVTYEGVTKLVDFGIAKARNSLGRTQVGTVKGTTGYMSPEQVQGDTLDGRSDVFCAGVVLYELLTGHRLFAGPTEYDEMVACLQAPIFPPIELAPHAVTKALNDVVMRALERDRDRRYATARDMARALELVVGQELHDPEQTAAIMRQLFQEKMGATRALLDSAGESEPSTSARRAVRLLREDANADFPSADQVAPALSPAEPAKRSVEATTGEATGVQLDIASLQPPAPPAASPPPFVAPSPVRASAPARRMSMEMELPRGRPTGGGGGAAEKRSERRPVAAKAPPPGSPARRAGPLTDSAGNSAPDRTGTEKRSASSVSTPVPRHEETQPAFQHEPPGGALQRRLAALELSVPMMLLVALLGALLLAGLGAIFFMGGDEALETKQALPTFQDPPRR